VARIIYYAGSIKWLDRPFDGHDLSELQRGATEVPGFDIGGTALVGVSRSGFADTAAGHLTLCWEPSDVVGAFA
jgi:hypothetical protein